MLVNLIDNALKFTPKEATNTVRAETHSRDVLFAVTDTGPEIRDDHAAYLGHWLQVLKDDKRAIFTAAAHAQRAADYLHSLQEQPAAQMAA